MLAHIDPIDYSILLNNNVVSDGDMVSSAHVNYMSVIHAVRRDVISATIFSLVPSAAVATVPAVLDLSPLLGVQESVAPLCRSANVCGVFVPRSSLS